MAETERVERVEPGFLLDEREMLDQWLDYHRATLLWKCEGLSPEQLVERSAPPSSMSLLGLVRHMADVERNWFRRVLTGEDVPGIFWDEEHPDGEFDLVDPGRVVADMATYAAERDRARELAAAAASLDVTGTHSREGQISLRWIMVHMIEEYARHNGHADLLRERIDGQTGD